MGNVAGKKDGVTIRDVARAAGVDRSSVSRAFTKPHMLRADTVERIRAVAQELGYVPNQTARGLSTGRYGNIGMVVPDLANPFFPPMIRAAQDEAEQADLCMFLGNSNEDPRREEQLAFRFLGQVEGLILASSRLPDDRLREIAEVRPLVLVNRDMEGIPRVLIDSAGGIAEAAAHLAGLGHRQVAYVSGPLESWSNSRRSEALTGACGEHGLSLTLLPAQVPTFEAGEAIVETFLGTGATVAVAFDDLTAHGLLNGLASRGIRVPDDIAVVGCDDVLARLTNPPLTSIGNRSPEAGKFAVKLLNGLLRSTSPRPSEERIVLETRLVVRASTA